MVDELKTDKDIQETSSSEFESILRRLSPVQWIMLIAVIGYWIYLPIYTQPVLNFKNETGLPLYAPSDPSNLVPKHSVSPGHAILGMALFIIFVYSFIREKPLDMLTEKQVKEIIRKDIHFKKTILKVPEFEGDAFVGPEFKLISHETKDRIRVPYLYAVGVKIVRDNLSHYYIAQVKATHPNQGYLYCYVRRKTPFREVDICPNCGLYSDVKLLGTEALKEMTFLRGLLRGR